MRTLRARSSELTTHCDSIPDWLLPDPIYSIWIYVLSLISYTLATSCEELTQRKDSDAGRDWRREEKGTIEDEMAGWHH